MPRGIGREGERSQSAAKDGDCRTVKGSREKSNNRIEQTEEKKPNKKQQHNQPKRKRKKRENEKRKKGKKGKKDTKKWGKAEKTNKESNRRKPMRHAPTGRIGNPDALGRETAQTTSAPGSRRSPTLNRTRRHSPLGPVRRRKRSKRRQNGGKLKNQAKNRTAIRMMIGEYAKQM